MAQVVIYMHEYTANVNACMHCEVATETIIKALVSLAVLVSKQPIMSHVRIIYQYTSVLLYSYRTTVGLAKPMYLITYKK